jgi:tetratricopeptide (TPR) repeat protein
MLHSGSLAQAEALLTSILREIPNDSDALQLLGLVAKQRGDLDGAEAYFRQSLTTNSAQPAVWNNLGNLLRSRGRLREATLAYDRAIALQPDYGDAWANLGLARSSLEQYEKSLEAFKRALLYGSKPDWILSGMASALYRLERLGEAEACAREAVSKNPKNLSALEILGNVLRSLGKNTQAKEVFHGALRQAPEDQRRRLALAGACYDLGEIEESEAQVRRILAVEPDNIEALRMMSLLLVSTGRSGELKAFFEDLINRNPVSEELWLQYLAALHQLNEPELGLQATERAEGKCGTSPALNLYRGKFLSAIGNSISAIRTLYGVARSGSVHSRTASIELSKIYLQEKRYLDGIRELEPLYVGVSQDYTLLAHLELLWRLSGDPRASWLMDYKNFIGEYQLPAPVGYRSIEEFNQALGDILSRLHVGSDHPPDQTLRNGTQTMGRLFSRTENCIRQLRSAVDICIKDFIDSLRRDSTHPFLRYAGNDYRFSGSWSVRLRSGGYHFSHFHPRGWISSAYYVSLPDCISTSKTDQGWLQFGLPMVKTGDTHQPCRKVQPASGKLVLFPSYCLHGTVPFVSNEPRLTVAFDAVPRALQKVMSPSPRIGP